MKRLFGSFLSLIILPLSSYAEELAFSRQIRPNRQMAFVEVPGGTSNLAAGTFFYTSRGKISEMGAIQVQGPAGLRIRVRAKLQKGTVAQTLASPDGWQKISLRTASGRNLPMIEIGSVPGSGGSPNVPVPGGDAGLGGVCAGASREILEEMVQIVNAENGWNLTVEEYCDLLNNQEARTQSPAPQTSLMSFSSAGYEVATFVLHKDSCVSVRNPTYVVRVDLTFSEVSAEDLAGGTEVGVFAQRVIYRGDDAATIKPRSEGRFAPKALVLMSTIGGGGQESVNVVQWKKGVPSSTKRLRVEDYTFYKGRALTRSVAESVLTGRGKATFELTNGSSIYSVCFELKKTRQKANGY